jgi:hypothetical protein
MNRREFTKLAALAVLTAPMPKLAWAQKAPKGLTIDQIISVAFPAVVADLHHGFYSDDLQKLYEEGWVKVASLLASNDVQEVSIPVSWTLDDEQKLSTEAQKITFATKLIEDAMWALDDIILGEIEGKQAVISEEYHYLKGETTILPNGTRVFMLYTAYLVID